LEDVDLDLELDDKEICIDEEFKEEDIEEIPVKKVKKRKRESTPILDPVIEVSKKLEIINQAHPRLTLYLDKDKLKMKRAILDKIKGRRAHVEKFTPALLELLFEDSTKQKGVHYKKYSGDDVEDGKFLTGFEAILITIHRYGENQLQSCDLDKIISLANDICEENLNKFGLTRWQGLTENGLLTCNMSGRGVQLTAKGSLYVDYLTGDKELPEEDVNTFKIIRNCDTKQD